MRDLVDRIRDRWPLLARVLVLVLLLAYAVLLFANASHAVGGADSSGYLNAARMFSRGQTIRPLPIPPEMNPKNLDAFVPLGFVRLPGTSKMASFYPPGLPLHLLAAAWIGGWNRGPFQVSPLATLGVVVLSFVLARRLVRKEFAFFAAAAMACCAVLIYQGLQPMSDAVAAFWCSAAAAAALWDRGTVAPALLAGAALGIAVLVRPTSLLMLAPLLLFLRPKQYHWFALGGIPFALLLGWYNLRTFGSPLVSGYSTYGQEQAFQLAGTTKRAAEHLWWTTRQLGPIVLAAAPVSLFLPYAHWRIRLGLFLWFAVFLICYSFFDVHGTWWYTRFILPGYPALMVMTAATMEQLLRGRSRWAWTGALLISSVTLVSAVVTSLQFRVFHVDEVQRPIRPAAEWVAQNLPPRSLLVCMEMSGAAISYTSHYPVRWDFSTVDERREWINIAARHGRGTWALLMPHEVQDARLGDPGTLVRELIGFQVFRLDPVER